MIDNQASGQDRSTHTAADSVSIYPIFVLSGADSNISKSSTER